MSKKIIELQVILLQELPQCASPGSHLCDVDPSQLLLESVSRQFSGQWQCVGTTEAGAGPGSANYLPDI